MALDEVSAARFSRQILVPGFAEEVQERLLTARVRVVGAGGAATAALVTLVQAGVGRIWIDDPDDATPADYLGWLFSPSALGKKRSEFLKATLSGFSRYTLIEPYPAGGVPDAALIFLSSAAQGFALGEMARRAGIPHVIVEPDAEDGAVMSIPSGAPCYSCARSSGRVWRPPEAGIAGLSALAAAELLLLLSDQKDISGRRIDFLRGVPTTRPTVRIPGCVCSPKGPQESPEVASSIEHAIMGVK